MHSEKQYILLGASGKPQEYLGLHPHGKEKKIIRVYRPEAKEIFVEVNGEMCDPKLVDEAGIFELPVSAKTSYRDYRIYHQNGLLAHDPYAFSPRWGEMDSHLLAQGVHYELYNAMGAREVSHQDVLGVCFTVWAPHARAVSVVGDFNFWDGRTNLMQSQGGSGIWELFVPGLKCGERYKFEIKTKTGSVMLKADPFAFASEHRPMTASVVANVDRFQWNDEKWQEKCRLTKEDPQPFNVYEVHLGSWKLSHSHHLNYRTLAHELSAYCKEMGYTHVELLPIMEHPLDESWGYQVSGFFAVTSRYGSVEDFQYFVDHMHQEGIGVFLDWVPGHFPSDAFSLARFDGTCLYEHEDPRQGYHPHWNTLIFNYGRHEVSNFLIANALFWLDKMHVDGLRVDAVASMLYLDYGRDEGGWIPNQHGGRENLEAIDFLKHLNSIIHERFPAAITMAEESSSFEGVTRPVQWDGLGFDYKWNMGWMNDSLRYFHNDPLYRRYHQNDLTFGLLYAFSERFILPLSHDEVVHGKKSLLSKMPGDLWQQFANLRLLFTYMMCQPGKKLLFMGAEIGQFAEWSVKEEVHWHLLQYPNHRMLQRMVKELNHFYLEHSELWHEDFDYSGFEWVDFSDSDHSIISYRRKADTELLIVHNFTPKPHPNYFLPLHGFSHAKELFCSDASDYGGSNQINESITFDTQEERTGIRLTLAPLSTHILEIS